MATINQLHSRIMRQIYLAFGLRVALHPLTILSLMGAMTLYMLARLVFVARVIESLANTPVGQLPAHAFTILVQADAPTLLATFVFAVVCVAFLQQVVELRNVLRRTRGVVIS